MSLTIYNGTLPTISQPTQPTPRPHLPAQFDMGQGRTMPSQQAIASGQKSFIQKLAKTNRINPDEFQNLSVALPILVGQKQDQLAAVIYKKEGYLTRLFGTESMTEWLEYKTALGSVFSLFLDTLHAPGLSLKGRLSKQDLKQAEAEAKTLLASLPSLDWEHLAPSKVLCGAAMFGVAISPKNPAAQLTALAVCLPAIHAAAQYGVNIITNSGAESGAPTGNGWTDILGNWERTSAIKTDGSYSFRATTQLGTNSPEMYQDIDVSAYVADIDARKQTFSYTGKVFQSANSPNTARIILEYRDQQGRVLSKYDTGKTFTVGSYSVVYTYSDTRQAPEGTRSIRLRFRSDKGGADSPNAVYYDANTLVANLPLEEPIPVPSPYGRELFNGGEGTERYPITEFDWVKTQGEWVLDSSLDFYSTNQPSSTSSELRQTIDVSQYTSDIDTRKQTFSFKGSVYQFPNRASVARYIIEYLDQSNTVLDRYDTGRTFTVSPYAANYGFKDTRVAPETTRSIRLRMIAEKGTDTIPDGVRFRDISIVANQPEALSVPKNIFNINLITEPGAERYPIQDFGWTTGNGNWEITLDAASEPQGQRSFRSFFQPGVQPSHLYLDILLTPYLSTIQSGKQRFDFSGYMDTSVTATGRLTVEYRDSNGFPLLTYNTGEIANTGWRLYRNTTVAPIYTQFVRINLFANQKTEENPKNVFFDHFYFGAQRPAEVVLPAPPFDIPPLVIKGDKGDAGINGTIWHHGTTVPSQMLGRNGDFYLKTDESTYFIKENGNWVFKNRLLGPQGNPGPQGIQGIPGINGNTWFHGLASPTHALGTNGDFYLNTNLSTYFIKENGNWVFKNALIGPRGEQGDQGLQGIQGPRGYNGTELNMTDIKRDIMSDTLSLLSEEDQSELDSLGIGNSTLIYISLLTSSIALILSLAILYLVTQKEKKSTPVQEKANQSSDLKHEPHSKEIVAFNDSQI